MVIPSRFAAIVPADATDLGSTIVALIVGGAGNLVVKGQDGNQVTIAVVAGQTVSGRFSRVMAATTATGIVAAYA